MSQKIITTLENIVLPKIAKSKGIGSEDIYRIDFELQHPSYGIKSVTSPWMVKYNSDSTKVLKKMQEHMGGLLFKEKVDGPFRLKVDIKLINNNSKLAKILKGAIKAGVGAYLGVLTGGISQPVLKAFAESGKDPLTNALFDKDTEILTIGSGYLDLDSSTLNAGTIDLNLGGKDIKKRVLKVDHSSHSKTNKTKWIDKVIVPKATNKTSVKIKLSVAP